MTQRLHSFLFEVLLELEITHLLPFTSKYITIYIMILQTIRVNLPINVNIQLLSVLTISELYTYSNRINTTVVRTV